MSFWQILTIVWLLQTPAVRRSIPDSAARALAAFAPFRVSRTPPLRPYATSADTAPAVALPPEQAALQLTGLVLSGHSVALLGGIPGVAGSYVVASGDTIRGLTILRIDSAGVHLREGRTIRTIGLTP